MEKTTQINSRHLLVALLITTIAQAMLAQTRVEVVDKPDTEETRNEFYYPNREPLLPGPLTRMPIGTIRPEGWLQKQLEIQADGMTGHLGQVSGYLRKENNAWRSPEGEGNNGWEEVPYWFRGFTALAYILQAPRLMEEAQGWIEPIINSQREDGYFGPRSNLREDGAHDMMPNMFMMHALCNYYEYSRDERIIELLANYFKWQLEIPDDKFFAGGWQVPRNADNLTSVYWLYNRTGDTFLLRLAEKLQRTGASWMHAPTGRMHNVDYSQGFRKPAQCYLLNKDETYLEQANKNYDVFHDIFGLVPGGMFCGDEFARPGFTDPRNAIETCGVVEMMQSQQILLQITGDLMWADRCEDIAYNSLPATQTADMKALRYLTAANMIVSDRANKAPEIANPGDMFSMNPRSHRCCQHNVSMGWPYFAANLWQATPANGVAAVFYAPSTLHARVGQDSQVTIEQTTQYPFDGHVVLSFSMSEETVFPLYLRIPGWCEGPEVSINGRTVDIAGRPRSFIRIDRQWSDGDEVQLHLPMEVRVKRWEKNHNSASIQRGPLTFSLKIGERYERYGGTEEWPAYEIFPTTPWNYALRIDPENPTSNFKVVHKPWPASNMIFTHTGSPVEIAATAHRVPEWEDIGLGLPGRMQDNPIRVSEPAEPITLIPMGACRLRLTAFPVASDDPTEARTWKPTKPMPASYWPNPEAPMRLHDGRLPVPPAERVGFFTWVGWAGYNLGAEVWVRQDFDEEEIVASSEVYWRETDGGWYKPLDEWTLQYLKDDQWKPVESYDEYEFHTDRFTKVAFKPVKTRAIRIFADLPDRQTAGIYEWRNWVKAGDWRRHDLRQNFGVDVMGAPNVRIVDGCTMIWFVNPKNPDSGLPEKWELYYRNGDDTPWKPVTGIDKPAPVADEPTVVTFDPVKATEMKMGVYAKPGVSAGPSEWKIHSMPVQ